MVSHLVVTQALTVRVRPFQPIMGSRLMVGLLVLSQTIKVRVLAAQPILITPISGE
jgi:hypothetical protein